MFIKKEDFNYYGLEHEKINERFEGDLSYCGTFCVLGMYSPAAVYKAKNPNKKKGHKKYFLLWRQPGMSWIVSGMSDYGIKKERHQTGIWCPVCGDVIYSVNRHDYRSCECKSCFIDGGKDYTRTNPESVIVEIDLITGKVEF